MSAAAANAQDLARAVAQRGCGARPRCPQSRLPSLVRRSDGVADHSVAIDVRGSDDFGAGRSVWEDYPPRRFISLS